MPHPVTSKKHLRVRTPRTTDGTQVLIEDGKVQYKTRFLPLSAKAELERQNAKLPKNLKLIIEEMPGDSGNSGSRTRQKTADTTKVTTASTGNDGNSGNSGNSGGDLSQDERREALLALTKIDLQEVFEKELGEAPKNALTKEQLADAIIAGEIPE